MSGTAGVSRPDECPNVASHVRPRRGGDYGKVRTHQCPDCGFWCLPATAQVREPVT